MDTRVDKVLIHGKVVLLTKVIGQKTKCMDKELISIQTPRTDIN